MQTAFKPRTHAFGHSLPRKTRIIRLQARAVLQAPPERRTCDAPVASEDSSLWRSASQLIGGLGGLRLWPDGEQQVSSCAFEWC